MGLPVMTKVSREYRPGGDYNKLPYTSMPISYTQPARLAAMAALHGLPTPAVERARVLEIGCASGGNIIPLAARFPNSQFLGIDLSAHHIELGAMRIAELGLSNIELRQGDIAQIDLSSERFDYVICHGVFSWVPKAAQDAIFKICSSSLTDLGVAAISYNVLPGWHTRSIIRDICVRHTSTETEPHRRVSMVRELLSNMAETYRDGSPYGLIIRSEAARLKMRPASYILGEFLAEENEPIHFKDLASRAAELGLLYLCEADLRSSQPEHLVPTAAAQIKRLTEGDPAGQQQYIDFFSGRTFRRSLLVRADTAGGKSRTPGPEQVRSLHCAAKLQVDVAASTEIETCFRDRANAIIKVRSKPVRIALTHLGALYPATAAISELADLCPSESARERLANEESISRAIFRLAASGRASFSSVQLKTGRSGSQFPHAWSLARAEAATDQPWVTSLNHTSVLLNAALKVLVRHMTGENNENQLAAALAMSVDRGEVVASEIESAKPPQSPTASTIDFGKFVERALDYCAAHALLVP